MELFDLLIFFLILVVSIIIRSYLILKYGWVGKDSFYHFIIGQEIRNKKKIPDTINNYIYPEKYDYPPLLHLLLSLFNKKYYQKLQYLGVFADIATGIIIYLFCLSQFNVNVAILACAFYLFTPMTIDGSFSLGPRSIANLFLVISLISFLYYYEFGLNSAIFVSVIFSLFVLLTHRLTTQSLIFSMIVLSYALRSIIPLYILMASIILGLIFIKRPYITVIKGHANFIKVFATKLTHKGGRKEMKRMFPNLISLLFNVPIFILFLMSSSLYESPITKYLSIIGLSLTILSFLWIFGEGIRHMSNAIFAFAILSALYISELNNVYLLIIFIFLSLLFSIYKLLRMEKMLELGNITTSDMISGFEYIKSHKKSDDLLLCIPLDVTYNAAYFTGCKMLQSSGGFANGLNFNQKLHNLLKEDSSKLIDEYSVDWIFLMIPSIVVNDGKIVFQSGDITIIKIDRK